MINRNSPSFRTGINSRCPVAATISPSVGGQSTIYLGVDQLALSSYGEWTITPVADVAVKVKVWGAGGARGFAYSSYNSSTNQGDGGAGGYGVANIVLRAGQSYVIRVGQGGARSQVVSSGATYLAGGIGKVTGGTQGGGYTGIFKGSVSQANCLLLAGGGGGGYDSSYASTVPGGGGTTGAGDVSGQGGQGGTQSAGGAASSYNSATAGSALTGGVSASSATGCCLGGGGGGYYGGGGGNVGGGGGGSGRLSTDSDVTKGSLTAASGSTTGASTDVDCGGAGRGGNSSGNTGADGKIVIRAV